MTTSPDGSMGASVDNEGVAYVWDTLTGEVIAKFEDHNFRLRGVTFANNREWIATAGWGGEVKIWEPRTGRLIKTITAHENYIWSVKFSKDDNYILTSSSDYTAKIHEIRTEKCIGVYVYGDELREADFSPREDLVVMVGLSGFVKIADIESEKIISEYLVHGDRINAGKFTPDGLSIITGSGDRTIKIIDYKTGENIKTLRGHSKEVYTVDVSPDGNYIMSGGYDGMVIVWEIATGDIVFEYEGFKESDVLHIEFSSNGKMGVGCSRDSTVKLFSLGELVDFDGLPLFLVQDKNKVYKPTENGLVFVLDLAKEELTQEIFESNGVSSVRILDKLIDGRKKIKVLALSGEKTPNLIISGHKDLFTNLGNIKEKSKVLIMGEDYKEDEKPVARVKGKKDLFSTIGDLGKKSEVKIMLDRIGKKETLIANIKGEKDLRKISENKPNLIRIYQDVEREDVSVAKIKGFKAPQLMLANGDIKLEKISKIHELTLKADDELEKIKIIFSLDSGETWQSKKVFEDGTKNIVVDPTNLKEVKNRGLTIKEFNSINEQWLEDITKSGKIRFGYYLDIDNAEEESKIDRLTIKADLYGYWEIQKGGKNYKNRYTNEVLSVILYKDGIYKVNYLK